MVDNKAFKPKERFWKRFKYKLQLWDGIWSVPLAAFAFILVGIFLQWIFGESVGFYDPSFIQVAFMASFVLILFNTISFFLLNFNFRHVWRYYVQLAKNDFDNLKRWQRICVLLGLYCFFIVAQLILIKLFI